MKICRVCGGKEGTWNADAGRHTYFIKENICTDCWFVSQTGVSLLALQTLLDRIERLENAVFLGVPMSKTGGE